MPLSLVYDLFFFPGEVVEIRAYGLSRNNPAWEGWAAGAGIVYGYFDNGPDFAKAAQALEKARAPGIYYTLNPVNPALLSRAVNRLKAADMKTSTTADADIKCVRWLPVDLDPRRPAGIPSTDDELRCAMSLRDEIWKWMSVRGFNCVPACSGNGAHLICRLEELDNTDATKEIIKSALAALSARFSNDEVEVDEKVFNPARIWKLYGTTVRKGDHTDKRPHRRSYIDMERLKTA